MNSLIRRLATHLLVNPIHGGVDGRPRAKHKKDKRPFLQAGRVFTGHRTAVNRRGGVSGVVTSDSDNDNVHSVTHARCALGANTPRRVDSLFQHQSDKPGDNENRRRKTQRPSSVERGRRCDQRLHNSSFCFIERAGLNPASRSRVCDELAISVSEILKADFHRQGGVQREGSLEVALQFRKRSNARWKCAAAVIRQHRSAEKTSHRGPTI